MVDYKNILFCTDFSEDANIAFTHALNLAKKYGARLHILHVPHSPFTYNRDTVDEHIPEGKAKDGQALYDADIARQAEKDLRDVYEKKILGFSDCVYVIRHGAPEVEIIRYAKANDIDLIVMGALGRADKDRLNHGSTVASVSKYAHCHVMAIRNPAKQFTLPGKMV